MFPRTWASEDGRAPPSRSRARPPARPPRSQVELLPQLDFEKVRWRRPKLLGAPPPPRYGHTALRHGPDIVVYGGREPGGLCDPQALLVLDAADRDAMRWRRVACAGRAPRARYEHAAVVVGESMVVYGGRGDGVGGGDAEEALGGVHVRARAAARLSLSLSLSAARHGPPSPPLPPPFPSPRARRG